MGQRHQIWLIAKVVPRDSTDNKAYYRSLGGFHNQWCYGRLPSRAVRRFVDLAKQKDNAEIIQIELDEMQNKYNRNANGNRMPSYPCPYTQFLLGLACCVDLDDFIPTYVSGHSYDGCLLPATTRGSFDHGPDDGISVIDVSDPMDPAYCHVLSNGPLPAEGYIRSYYAYPADDSEKGDSELEKDIAALIASLDDVKLVTTEMLAEAWPRDYARAGGGAKTDEVADPSDQPTLAEDNIVPQLADLVVGPAVKQSIAQGNFDELEKLVWIPEKATLIKAALREFDPFPNAAIPLLLRVCEVESQTSKSELDLTGLPLSSDQILDFVSQHSDIQRLKLSNMPHVTIDTLRKLLTSVPPISHLNLLGTSIANESILELLAEEPKLFYSMEALIHPALLTYAKKALYKAAFTFPGISGASMIGGCSALPFFTPQRIVQAFSDFLRGILRNEMSMPGGGLRFGAMGSSMLALACLASYRTQGQKWSERRVPILPLFCDGFFSGEGWALIVSDSVYSFCRLLDGEAEGGGKDVLDLDGFLSAMGAEGRPAPLPASVSELKGFIAEAKLQAMDVETVEEALQTLQMNVQVYPATYQRRI
ncbi:hypothetical protein BDN71DRAFT_1412454 [Pleurotus eryngii]|uniref:Uncharacterized protein n=1 Tax=Pleurotus eryngii TaxID=5323 RepID=A0A9P6D9S6_PLEER|nr:hypothetical protein BDN71DRAFT_1412454 [Pleurotus eryngii]